MEHGKKKFSESRGKENGVKRKDKINYVRQKRGRFCGFGFIFLISITL